VSPSTRFDPPPAAHAGRSVRQFLDWLGPLGFSGGGARVLWPPFGPQNIFRLINAQFMDRDSRGKLCGRGCRFSIVFYLSGLELPDRTDENQPTFYVLFVCVCVCLGACFIDVEEPNTLLTEKSAKCKSLLASVAEYSSLSLTAHTPWEHLIAISTHKFESILCDRFFFMYIHCEHPIPALDPSPTTKLPLIAQGQWCSSRCISPRASGCPGNMKFKFCVVASSSNPAYAIYTMTCKYSNHNTHIHFSYAIYTLPSTPKTKKGNTHECHFK
jgi:hypothetical protein